LEEEEYGVEREAIKIQANLLKKVSKELCQANLGKVLLFAFRDIILEKELYWQPQQDLSKLYA